MILVLLSELGILLFLVTAVQCGKFWKRNPPKYQATAPEETTTGGYFPTDIKEVFNQVVTNMKWDSRDEVNIKHVELSHQKRGNTNVLMCTPEAHFKGINGVERNVPEFTQEGAKTYTSHLFYRNWIVTFDKLVEMDETGKISEYRKCRISLKMEKTSFDLLVTKEDGTYFCDLKNKDIDFGIDFENNNPSSCSPDDKTKFLKDLKEKLQELVLQTVSNIVFKSAKGNCKYENTIREKSKHASLLHYLKC